MNKSNIVASLLFIALSIWLFITSYFFPKAPSSMFGPGLFPMILASGLMIMSIILLVQTLLEKKNSNHSGIDIKSPEIRRSFTSLIATIIYVIAMNYLGFIVSTVIFLLFLMYLLKNREYIKMIIVSIVVSIAIQIIFKTVLHITLPSGFLI